ncbi:MAG TPA: helix-turn-helix domain-containing protein [Ktedonosporobacter sp.]|nr:helix-turn-helix domain-containing protein [Ktedonosporobacter sp.]
MTDNRSELGDLLSAREAGTMLRVTAKTVIRLAESGQLSAYKVGTAWRFKRADVEAYLEAHKYQPGQQADEDKQDQ